MKPRSALLCLPAFLGLLLWLGLGISEDAAARAGGAGGGSTSSKSSGSKSSGSRSSGSRSSGSKSSGRSSYRSNYSGGSSSRGSSYGSSGSRGTSGSGSLKFTFVLLTIGVGVAVAAVILHRRSMAARFPPPTERERSRIRTAPINGPRGLDEFLHAHPDFDPGAFAAKVRSAFMKIQRAWTEQDLSSVRPFLSDGMYQRFATQFRMMELLKQRNVLDEIQVFGAHPIDYRIDGAFDVIDVWISAAMSDSFTCELDPSMNSESHDPFIEHWSFIRKRGAADSGFDIVSDKNCPSCAAELPADMGELCRCTHCQVLVNSGDFDWVLAEITQEADYDIGSRMTPLVSPELEEAMAAVAGKCPDFSRQVVEDKASNAFMQIMTAYATRNPASVRRFVTDELFAGLSAKIPDHGSIFHRIYLNECVLLNVGQQGAVHRCDVGLSASMQRAGLLPAGGLALLDAGPRRRDFTLTLERDIDAVPEKGSLYQHQCSACGGRVGDTLDVTCQYCGTALNSTRHEWIVSGFEEN
ncbi:TIM44-like domain-containing protein [Luteolibacter arcticus]|uniref:TIM44-like domain-containing protein n=1 Tax=Luteolibacter arcticus TaxID=1581411 RepID=A0ABT3GJZ9_9BACT|nr:TIM44-like domain-containing protein [Luteolibacter arcticus]MCW1923796.1 TIM44-like domain-containing protein [Luteolibacter arcticus]